MSLLPVGIGPQEGGYQIERSLRFNSADSAYLSRTPASAGNGQTFTISFWLKRSAVNSSSANSIFEAYSNGGNKFRLWFTASGNSSGADNFSLENNVGSTGYSSTWNPKYRDTSAWYHFMYVANTTSGTASERQKVYVNGELVSAYYDQITIPQNQTHLVNSNVVHYIGRDNGGNYLNGLITEFYIIDGSALDPTSFGEYNTDTGVWQPKAYTGSYGTNGFYLDFADNSSTTALGYDAAGSNDWTPNNFSVTAGAGNDSLVDTPTPYGTDTGAGGEVRGNYATFNPLDKGSSVTLANGNLDATLPEQPVSSTIAVSSGKYYSEVLLTTQGSVLIGWVNASYYPSQGQPWDSGDNALYYAANGQKVINNSFTAYASSATDGDVIGVAVDLDSDTIEFFKNGSSLGSFSKTFTGNYKFVVADATTATNTVLSANFGQRPFAYTAPSGFKALCTQNLPEPTVVDGGNYFNAVTYTGDATERTIDVGFQPDFLWIKTRSNASSHNLVDSVRGVKKLLSSNSTDAELTESDTAGVDAFVSNGFTLEDSTFYEDVNQSGRTYVAWNWKAGGTGVSNTAGSITSTVSANTTAGFSIVTWTGNGTSGATVGHGLGVAPSMVIVKQRNGTEYWPVYHASLGSGYRLSLQGTNASGATSLWNTSNPTSTVIAFNNDAAVNGSGSTYVMYAFAPVEGYSAFGSYTGNGSDDGPFVFCGFRPRYLMWKNATTAGNGWIIWDTARNPYNLSKTILAADQSIADYDATSVSPGFPCDILSNGFKLRGSRDTGNNSGATFIYAAFAEVPMKFALGS